MPRIKVAAPERAVIYSVSGLPLTVAPAGWGNGSAMLNHPFAVNVALAQGRPKYCSIVPQRPPRAPKVDQTHRAVCAILSRARC